MKKNVVVIAGGNTSEYDISIQSGNHIYSVIDEQRYNKYFMVLKGRDWHIEIGEEKYPVDKNDFGFTIDGEKILFDFAYITIHGIPGENGSLQGYLDMMGVPYSTCTALCEAITFDKYTCINYLSKFGIPVTNPVLLTQGQSYKKEDILNTVGLPCFVKPNAEGSSFGVSKVNIAEDFDAAIQEAFSKCKEILVEPYLQGKEFTCGLYKAGNKKVVFPVAEVVSKKEFFDFEAKYQPELADEHIPARFPDEISRKIQEVSAHIYDILRCDGIVRIDGFLSQNNDLTILEVNTTPGMTSNSFIPKMVKVAGMDLKEVLTEIIEAKNKLVIKI
ncbi:MAG: D-alanine--D-alanine ligase [Odoribacter sp.]|nr:D-alanine--D-alanine ligase [Odoribacter sp.]